MAKHITRRKALKRMAAIAGAAAATLVPHAARAGDQSPDPFDGFPLMWGESPDEVGDLIFVGPGQTDAWVVTSETFWGNDRDYWVILPLDPNSPTKRDCEAFARSRGSRVLNLFDYVEPAPADLSVK